MTRYISGVRPSAVPSVDEPSSKDRNGWWTTPFGRWRLSVEVEAMKRFPGFHLCSPAAEGLCWLGEIRSSFDPASRYAIAVTYPPAFPDEAPLVAIEEPTLPPETPHVTSGNRPCLYRPTQGSRNGYDPARTTAATLIGWTALWVHAFETWRATGEWPGIEE